MKSTDLRNEYTRARGNYVKYTSYVKKLLVKLLKDERSLISSITNRTKEHSSLIRKFEKFKPATISMLDDISGCRIICHREKSKNRIIQILSEGLPNHGFKISKINPRYEKNSYSATHIVITPNSDSNKNGELKVFKGMNCEIQILNMFENLWAEVSHEVLYKKEEGIRKFSPESYDTLVKNLEDTMVLLRQASYNIEVVERNSRHIVEGKQIFSKKFLKKITESSNINEIYSQLKLLQSLLEDLGPSPTKDIDLLFFLRNIVNKVRYMRSQKIRTEFGTLPGNTHNDVIKLVFQIINILRYLYIEEVVDILIEFYRDKNKYIRQQALEIIKNSSEYNFHALKGIGYFSQNLLLDKLEKLDDKELVSNSELVIQIANSLLLPEFEGTEHPDYKTISFLFGPLKGSETLKNIRNRCIDLLFKLHKNHSELQSKIKILECLGNAFRKPSRGTAPEQELIDVIHKNAKSIIAYYTSNIATFDWEEIREVEEQLYWLNQHGFPQKNLIEDVYNLIDSNEDYQIYKACVGFDYRNRNKNWGKSDADRETKIDEYISNISEDNKKEWGKRIRNIAKHSRYTNHGEMHKFGDFLSKLGTNKADIAEQYMHLYEKELKPFAVYLLSGLWKGGKAAEVKSYLVSKAKSGDYLYESMHMSKIVETQDQTLTNEALKKAKETNDITALESVIFSIAHNYTGEVWQKENFLDAVNSLTQLDSSNWSSRMYFRKTDLLNDLSSEEWDDILRNLLLSRNVDFDVENLLCKATAKYIEKVLGFFFKRIKYYKKLPSRTSKFSYDAVPYEFQLLQKEFEKQLDWVVGSLLSWMDEKDWLFGWEAGRMLQNIFPSFNLGLESKLSELINTGDKGNISKVLNVLHAYKGEHFTHNTYKELIEKSHWEDYKSDIISYISQTGVVSGEYGLVHMYEGKIEAVKDWKNDSRKEVRKFAKEYEMYLRKMIIYEKKQADDTQEMLRRGALGD